MNEYVVAADLESVLLGKVTVPTTLMWNRLEGRPRTIDFSRALKSEVRDPLWMLARQWQMGEFIGDDAASPVVAKIAWSSDRIAGVRGASGSLHPYDPAIPLEARTEARPVELERAGRIHNADTRLALGHAWQQLIEDGGHGSLVPAFRNQYRFKAPDPANEADYPLTTSAPTWQLLAALAGRAIDGGELLLHLRNSGSLASDNLGLSGTTKEDVDKLGEAFLAWAGRRYIEPDPTLPTWVPRQLEYNFGLSTPHAEAAAALGASEYHGGRLDWYHFDAVTPEAGEGGGAAATLESTSFFPASAQFEGMPNSRHWTFEESATNFGDIRPDTQDLAKLLLIEFGLVFGNDWFLLPIELEAGSLSSIHGLAITNVFGERTWIEPAVDVAGSAQNWQMYRLANKGAADGRLFLPPATVTALESDPVEAIDFVRDEVSNMVWGVERTVQLADGGSRRGRQLADALHARYQADIAIPAPAPPTNDAKIAYRLMTSVSEHWIPFIPVHMENDSREIQLQRAAMPRLLEGQQGMVPARIRPRTSLLREGMDQSTPHYFIAEEEIERTGTVIETRWQRCRSVDGRVVVWLSHERSTGRIETSSGLAFDGIVPKPDA